jgi:hypothetical protein
MESLPTFSSKADIQHHRSAQALLTQHHPALSTQVTQSDSHVHVRLFITKYNLLTIPFYREKVGNSKGLR